MSNKTFNEVGNITKAAIFKCFLHLSYKNNYLFFATVLFNISMRQTLTDDFLDLHKNMNCAFPLRTITNISSTYEGLVWCVIRLIPTDYNRVDIVADAYKAVSIMIQQRVGRGRSNHTVNNSVKLRTPCDFKEYLSNGENKSKLITLFEYFVIKKAKVLNNLRATKLVLVDEGKTTVKTLISDAFSSDQEESNIKVILHCNDALKENSNGSIIRRSASAGNDILVVAVAYLYNERQRVYIDSGRSTSRKINWMMDVVMSEYEVHSSISFHALTGNDYFSSFL